MSNAAPYIAPFNPDYEAKALVMEKSVVQGRHVQLQLVKTQFLSRAVVFDHHYGCIALNDQQEVIAASVAAQTTIRINNKEQVAGIAFDTKVADGWRKKGIGRLLAKHLFSHFFTPQGIEAVFMTAKKSNLPAMRLARWMAPATRFYPFVYLAIPAHARLKNNGTLSEGKQLFHVQLFHEADLPAHYYKYFSNKLGCFFTSRMYTLKIKKISSLYKAGIAALKMMAPAKYAGLPAEGSTLSCAVLFNHTASNINGINAILENLQTQKIDQLLVCCQRNDTIYKAVLPLAVHCYDYCILSDFGLQLHDTFTIDARCL